MSSSFSANQYENAFKSNKLQNWTVPKHFKEKPLPAKGQTVFIATDRGHLHSGVKRGCPWPSFQGTWDLPSHIPPIHINPTARSEEGQQRLRAWGQLHHMAPSAPTKLNETNKTSKIKQCEGTHDSHQHEGISERTPAPLRPELERTSQSCQTKSRPASQRSQDQSRPASQRSQDHSRPATQQGQVQSRPASQRSKGQSRPITQQSNAVSTSLYPKPGQIQTTDDQQN